MSSVLSVISIAILSKVVIIKVIISIVVVSFEDMDRDLYKAAPLM